MMKSRSLYRLINGSFLLVLIIPAIAVLQSYKLREVVAVTIRSPDHWDEQREVLRRSTGLWSKAVESYSKILYGLGASNSKSVAVVGRDGWVFLGDIFNNNMAQALGRRHFNKEDIVNWTQALKGREHWLARRDIRILFVVAPAKWSIYPDKLPVWTEGRIGKRRFDQLLSGSEQLPFIDLRPVLKGARKIADTYSPLSSHWNNYGAWVAWGEIAKKLAELDPALSGLSVPILKSIKTVDGENEFATMVNLTFKNPWMMPVFDHPLTDFEIVGTGQSLSGNTETNLLELPRNTRNMASGNHFKALVLRDSMGNSLSPYLQAAFEETYQVGHNIDQPHLSPNVPYLVESYKPKILIYVMTERHFNNVLQDGGLWDAANAYDLASVHVAAWSEDKSSSEAASLMGDGRLVGPVTFRWDNNARMPHVMRIFLESSAPGSITLRAQSKNSEIKLTEQYVSGGNILFFNLPELLDASQVTLARSGNVDAAVQIKSIDLRATPINQ